MSISSIVAVVDCEYHLTLAEVVRRRLVPLAAAGCTVSVLLLRSPPELRGRLIRLGITVRTSDCIAAADWAAIRDLATLSRSARASLLYAHGELAHLLCALVGPLLGIPVIAHLLGAVSLSDAQAYALCHSAAIVATEHARSQALAIGCNDVVVVPTPACTEAMASGRPGRRIVLGWAGAWNDDDNPELFLRALARIAAGGVPVEARMAIPLGYAPRTHLEEAAVFRNAVTWSRLTFGRSGFTEGIDIYVHTASVDATHVTLVDALAAGLRVIATTAGGSSELLAAGRRMWLYAPGDEAALFRALREALTDLPGHDLGEDTPAVSGIIESAESVRAVMTSRVAAWRLPARTGAI